MKSKNKLEIDYLLHDETISDHKGVRVKINIEKGIKNEYI
jgi:hypothetical protein